MAEPSPLQKTAKKIYTRLGLSVLAYMIFVGMALNAFFIERVAQVSIISVVPLAAAVILLPRNSRRGHVAGAEPTEDEDETLRARINSLANLGTILRISYLGLTLLIYMGLPYLVPAAS